MTRPSIRRRASLLAIIVLIMVTMVQPLAASTRNAEARATNGMVAAAHPLAAEAGIEILKAGGNVIDAAVATAFAVGVVEPMASNLSAEGVMLIHLADSKKTLAIDYRAQAPRATSLALEGTEAPRRGWLSMAVPGLVAGLAKALDMYGTMTLEQVLAPSIRLASEGFPISDTLAGLIEDSYELFLNDPELFSIYLDDGLPPLPGWVLKNPDLAETLKTLAKEGPDAFYKGSIADAIDAASKANGGYITKQDLASYEVLFTAPVSGSYRGYDIFAAPPPSGGYMFVNALQVLENFDLGKQAYPNANSVHLICEAHKRAYMDHRSYNGDPRSTNVPVKDLTSKFNTLQRAWEISIDAMTPKEKIKKSEFGKKLGLEPEGQEYSSPSTTQISLIDKSGNMVSITQTIAAFWGSGIVIPGTGILMNDSMINYGTSSRSKPEPGKRCRLPISPAVVLKKGKPFLAFGGPGSDRIVCTNLIVFSNVVDHGMGLQDAIEAPRFFARDESDRFEYEANMPQQVIEGLRKKGYPIEARDVRKEFDMFFGGVQAVMMDPKTGELVGAADPRRDGAAVGY